MTEENECERCGLEYDAIVEIDHASGEHTAGIKTENKQLCFYSNSNGAWIYIHREGGGKSET